MAKKHKTVIDLSGRVIGGRINENFGLTTYAVSYAITSGAISLDTSIDVCNVVALTGTDILSCINGGLTGQTIVIVNGTTAAITVTKYSNTTAGSTNNIVGVASGSFTINATKGPNIVCTNVEGYWIVNSSST